MRGYKAIIISTIVDNLGITRSVSTGYKAIIISTIVDRNNNGVHTAARL